MFCWETVGLGIRVDVTLTRTTDLNIVADQVPHYTALVLLNGSDLAVSDRRRLHNPNLRIRCQYLGVRQHLHLVESMHDVSVALAAQGGPAQCYPPSFNVMADRHM